MPYQAFARPIKKPVLSFCAMTKVIRLFEQIRYCFSHFNSNRPFGFVELAVVAAADEKDVAADRTDRAVGKEAAVTAAGASASNPEVSAPETGAVKSVGSNSETFLSGSAAMFRLEQFAGRQKLSGNPCGETPAMAWRND